MHYFTPDEIAFFISNNGITESYHGLRVVPGNSPIDYLLFHIDRNYLDFDPSDKKFLKAASEILKYIPKDNDEWIKLINQSSQSQQLKQLLITNLGGQSVQQSQPNSQTYRITLKSGRVFEAEIGDIGKDWIYLGLGPAGKYQSPCHKVSVMKQLGWFLGYDPKGRVPNNKHNPGSTSTRNTIMFRKYSRLITVKKSNIVSKVPI